MFNRWALVCLVSDLESGFLIHFAGSSFVSLAELASRLSERFARSIAVKRWGETSWVDMPLPALSCTERGREGGVDLLLLRQGRCQFLSDCPSLKFLTWSTEYGVCLGQDGDPYLRLEFVACCSQRSVLARAIGWAACRQSGWGGGGMGFALEMVSLPGGWLVRWLCKETCTKHAGEEGLEGPNPNTIFIFVALLCC